MQARPVIKWVGGKTQLIPALLEVFPKKIHTYYEPFIGGGAVFYSLASNEMFAHAILNDWNKDLVNVYQVVRDSPEELMEWLRRREEAYALSPEANYGSLRNPDNEAAKLLEESVARAGRFIFLNKTGFNGLYRVNRKGQCNVPWGKKPTIRSFDEENIRACARVLKKNVTMRNGDFVAAVEGAKEGDLVYFDPPYVPVNPTSNFTTYTENGFGLPDQQRLAVLFRELSERGVSVVLSNSDTEIVRDLYKGFEIREIQVRRAINSKGDKRGPVGEVIVVGRRAVANVQPALM